MAVHCKHEGREARATRFHIRVVCQDCNAVLNTYDRRTDPEVHPELRVDEHGRLVSCGELSTAPLEDVISKADDSLPASFDVPCAECGDPACWKSHEDPSRCNKCVADEFRRKHYGR